MHKTMIPLAALAFLAAGVSPLAAAEITVLDKTDNWQVVRIITVDHQPGCSLWTPKPDAKGTQVLLLAQPNKPITFNLTNPSWALPAGEEYQTTIRTGTTQSIDLKGKANTPTQITYYMKTLKEYQTLAIGLFTGSYLSVPIPDKRVELSLAGNGALMKSWDSCTASLFANKS